MSDYHPDGLGLDGIEDFTPQQRDKCDKGNGLAIVEKRNLVATSILLAMAKRWPAT